MSIQHVFESARRLGLPVIMTDVGGRDPMVVLPLEQFEAMAGESPVKPSKPGMHAGAKHQDNAISLPVEEMDSLSNALPNQEVPMDERFYLEPVDEDKA